MILKQKEIYENVKGKMLNELDAPEKYLTPIVFFGEFDSKTSIDSQIDNYNGPEVYLWALFGKREDEKYATCLQVGASKDGLGEIKDDVDDMFDSDYSISKGTPVVSKNTQFYEDAYEVPENDQNAKLKYLYRMIKEQYSELCFYRIDIDAYLDVDMSAIKNEHVKQVFNMSKSYYAETKFAFETQSLYWNAYRSGVGMDTLLQLISKNE